MAINDYSVFGGEDEDSEDDAMLGDVTGLDANSDPREALRVWREWSARGARQAQNNLAMLQAAQERIRQQRFGPSSSEQLLAVAAALGQPTRTGSFGETMGNLAGVLQKNAAERRTAEEEKRRLLEEYGLKVGSQQMSGITQSANQAGQMYRAAAAAEAARARAAAAAAKGSGPAGVIVGPDFVPRNKATGVAVKEAPANVVYELQDYLNDPEQTPEDKRIAMRNFDSKYGFGAAQMYLGGK